tara:strand:+ start:1716 stop:1982 length:267 start_codon:yes stop_codon:yes gene_type:complete
MNEKESFGQISSKDFKIGDIVEWSIWDTQREKWKLQYGILMEVKNEIRVNRLVSIATVVPLQGPKTELEFFAMSLRIVSASEKEKTNR